MIEDILWRIIQHYIGMRTIIRVYPSVIDMYSLEWNAFPISKDRSIIEPNLSGVVDLIECRIELFLQGLPPPQPDVDANEQVRLEEDEEASDAIDSLLQLVRLSSCLVLGCLQALGTERTEEQG